MIKDQSKISGSFHKIYDEPIDYHALKNKHANLEDWKNSGESEITAMATFKLTWNNNEECWNDSSVIGLNKRAFLSTSSSFETYTPTDCSFVYSIEDIKFFVADNTDIEEEDM